MKPTERFIILLEMLKIAFQKGSSEEQYHKIVRCLHDYNACPCDQKLEEAMVVEQGWPSGYRPRHHMESIRWGICFGKENPQLQELLTQYGR